jgi:hypothetical protein
VTRKALNLSKDIQRNGRHFCVREQATFHVQSNYPRKVLIEERSLVGDCAGLEAQPVRPALRRGALALLPASPRN